MFLKIPQIGVIFYSADDHVYYPFEYKMTPMGQNFKICFSINIHLLAVHPVVYLYQAYIKTIFSDCVYSWVPH